MFITPVRPALTPAITPGRYGSNRRLAGEGVSIQAYGLRRRILEVDRWVREHPPEAFSAGWPCATYA